MTDVTDVARRRTVRRLLRVAWHATRRFDVDSRLRMVAFLRRVWTEGLAERSVLVALAALIGAASLAALSAAPFVASLQAVVGVGLFALAWSVVFAAAADTTHPMTFVAVSAWLIFYQVLMCGPWIGTPIAVLPPAWLAWILFRRLRSDRSVARSLTAWLVIAAGLAYVTAGPSGLRRLLGWDPVDARLLLWVGLAIGGLIGFSRERPRSRPPGFSYAFWGALAGVGLAGGASLVRDPAGTVESLHLVFEDAAAIVVLFWLWTAGRVAAEGVKLVEWTVRHSVRLLPSRLILPGVPLVILGTLVAAHVNAAPSRDPLAQAIDLAGIWAGIATLGIVTWCALTRRLTTSRTILALAWWLIARIVLAGVVTGSREVIEAHEAQAPVVGFGLILVTAGLLLELGKLARNWADATPARVRGSLAMVALSVSCAVVLSTEPGNDWETTRLLMVLVGMLHLGVPLALYETWGMRSKGPVLEVTSRILILAAGYTAGILVLVIDPQRWSALLAGVPLLVLLLAWVRRHRPDLPPAAGMLAGVLFTGGLIAAWMHPNPPTIPFVPWAVLPRGVVLDKPLLSALHLRVLAIAWAAGAGLGWLTFRRSGERPK